MNEWGEQLEHELLTVEATNENWKIGNGEEIAYYL